MISGTQLHFCLWDLQNPKKSHFPQRYLKMGTITSCDINQQIVLFALEKVLNSIIHFHAVGIYVSSLMSFTSESHLPCPSDKAPHPQTRPRISETWG